MFKSLKRVLATASTLALLVTNGGVALAQTFKDVPTDAWYYDYVEQLVDDGVVDAGNAFRPNDSLNRAELVKIVITAIDGLADYEAPATPTFDDVPTNAWYYDYVEAAVQLGIVEGYKNAQGNLTGKFGPSDIVNRAAATKILVNAFSVPTTLSPASKFSDVKSGAWFYDFVVTAYNQSILDGYANGKFGPSDPVTRAQVAKLVVNAQNPTERVAGEGEGEGEGSTIPTSKGALEVSLNDANPASSTLPISASSVKLASFDFTAADDDVIVSNVIVTRGGVGKSSDWAALYIYEGAKRLTTGRTINADTNTATFALNATIDAGTTKTLTLVGDVDTCLAGCGSNQHYFYISDAAAVTTNATSVAGDFPVAGNTFTMGGAATKVNNITVAPGTAPSQPTIGQKDAEVASIKLTAGATNDIAVHQITLTQAGSLGTDKMTNLRLLRGTDEVATVSGFTGDLVTFVLATPYVIPKGQNKSFYVHTDINGGRTADAIKLYLDENTDMVAIDQQYGYGAVVVNNFGSAAAANLTLKGGDVTITDNGPASKQVAQNATNIHLLDWSVTAARDLTVRDQDLVVGLQYVNAGLAGPSVAVLFPATLTAAPGIGAASPGTVADFCIAGIVGAPAGLAVGDAIKVPLAGGGTVYTIVKTITADDAVNCNAGGAGNDDNVTTYLSTSTAAVGVGATFKVEEVNPYTMIKNIKIIDVDSGSTLQGPLTDGTSTTTLNGGGAFCFYSVLGACVGPNYTTQGDFYFKAMTEDYELTGGETRHLAVLVDTSTDLPAGYSIFAAVRYSDGTANSYLKDMAANEFVLTSNIVGAGNNYLQGKLMTSAANSLIVNRASTPSSNTYVKGDDKVPSLGISASAGDAGDIIIKKMQVRVYANTLPTPWIAAVGDTAANNLVGSVTLYDGNDVVDGPRSLTLVDFGGGTYTAGVDYYKALFDNLNLKITKGSTKTYVAKVKLLNTMAVKTYVAVDMLPSADIAAEDADANTITPSDPALPAVGLNGVVAKLPQLEVLTSGTLNITQSSSLENKNIVAGATMQLVAKYRLTAQKEGFNIDKVTITNCDSAATCASFPAFSVAVGVPAPTASVGQVVVKYTDVNGVTQTKTGSLSNGKTTLSGLTAFAPAGADAYIEVYANVSAMKDVDESLSGQQFRLGLADTANDVSTFNAVGSSSSATINAPAIGNNPAVKTFVVRKTIPTFAKASAPAVQLSTGENMLFPLTISADAGGPVSLGRLSFTVTNNIAGAVFLTAPFRFATNNGSTTLTVADNSLVSGSANIHCSHSVAGTCVTNLADVSTAGNVIATTKSADIIVSFFAEEVIDASSSTSYQLYGTVGPGALASGDGVKTVITATDELVPVAGILATSVCGVANDQPCSTGNGNTGLIFGGVAANEGLFVAAATEFFNTQTAGRAIVWSDNSANDSAYPTITAGLPNSVDLESTLLAAPPGPFGYDWTNGYLLKVPTSGFSVSK